MGGEGGSSTLSSTPSSDDLRVQWVPFEVLRETTEDRKGTLLLPFILFTPTYLSTCDPNKRTQHYHRRFILYRHGNTWKIDDGVRGGPLK